MTRTQFAVTLVVVAVAGLVGGALSERMRGRPAVAQAADEPLAIDRLVVDDLVAKSILVDGDNDQRVFLQNNAVTLVTDDGVRAAFRLDADGNPSVDLVDSKGKSRAEFGLWTDAGIGGLLLRNAEGAHLAEGPARRFARADRPRHQRRVEDLSRPGRRRDQVECALTAGARRGGGRDLYCIQPSTISRAASPRASSFPSGPYTRR
jgi:hypothetical protein